jgi:hypothetical protein
MRPTDIYFARRALARMMLSRFTRPVIQSAGYGRMTSSNPVSGADAPA